MQSYGPISWDIDFDAPGVRHGRLRLLHSDDTHAYGEIPIPISVLKNGDGPTMLLSAGNHGNEYEGQIVLRNLLAGIDLERLSGRLIILPALNYPAVRADQRVSPLDDGNLNRAFPGAPDQGPTRAIAGFVTNHLLPMADWAIDFHSGDRSSEFLPSAFLCTCADPVLRARNVDFATVFGAPWTNVVDSGDWLFDFDTHAHAQGIPMISTELGGGSRVTPRSVGIGASALRRVLDWVGVYPKGETGEPAATTWLKAWGGDFAIPSPADGLFEPLASLGDAVKAGQPAARIHTTWSPGDFTDIAFPHDGIVAVVRQTTAVIAGGYLFTVLPETDRDAVLGMIV